MHRVSYGGETAQRNIYIFRLPASCSSCTLRFKECSAKNLSASRASRSIFLESDRVPPVLLGSDLSLIASRVSG
jgi:hypothetical protein